MRRYFPNTSSPSIEFATGAAGLALVLASLVGCSSANGEKTKSGSQAVTGVDTNPFDPASCTGPELTAQEALAYLNPTTGVLDVTVGNFQVYRQWRQTYTGFPSGPWQSSGVEDVTSGIQVDFDGGWGWFCADCTSVPAIFSGAAGESLSVPLSGAVHVNYANDRPYLTLDGAAGQKIPISSTNDATPQFLVSDWDFTSSNIPAPVYSSSVALGEEFGAGGQTGSTFGLAYGGQNGFTFQSAVATTSCVRLAFDATENETDSNGNTWVKESQLVVFGNIGGGAGEPSSGDDTGSSSNGPACTTGQTACGSTCVNLANDPNNCGACGNQCTGSSTCVNSACAASCGATGCPAGMVDCEWGFACSSYVNTCTGYTYECMSPGESYGSGPGAPGYPGSDG